MTFKLNLEKRKIAAGMMNVKNVNIKNDTHNLTTHTHKHTDEATTPAKLSYCNGGIVLKTAEVWSLEVFAC